MRLLNRIGWIILGLMLALSTLFWLGMGFGVAFITDFTVTNRSKQSIIVTPVGSFARRGLRSTLPTIMWRYLPLYSFKSTRYPLEPGETVKIYYDMDDIQFTELAVELMPGDIRQFVVGPPPTSNQYSSPAMNQIVIDDLDSLQPAIATVNSAAMRDRQWRAAMFVNLTLFGPWVLYALVMGLQKLAEKREKCQRLKSM